MEFQSSTTIVLVLKDTIELSLWNSKLKCKNVIWMLRLSFIIFLIVMILNISTSFEIIFYFTEERTEQKCTPQHFCFHASSLQVKQVFYI